MNPSDDSAGPTSREALFLSASAPVEEPARPDSFAPLEQPTMPYATAPEQTLPHATAVHKTIMSNYRDVEQPPPESAPPSIPLVTSVIVIPNEPVREDTERFWQFDQEQPEQQPKDGIGLLKGWVREISPYYTIIYFVTVVFVTIALIGLTGVFGGSCVLGYSYEYSWGTECYKRSPIFIEQCTAAALYGLFVLARVLFCCSPCGDFTYAYLRNRKGAEQVQQLLDQYRACEPKIHLYVKCWHTETTGSGDDKRTKTVVTYRAKERVFLDACRDVTLGINDVNLQEYRMTKVKLTKSIKPDCKFQAKKKTLYDSNKHRDAHCQVSEEMEIEEFDPYMLACVNNTRQAWHRSFLLNAWTYALVNLLLYPALPYRIWLCSITAKVKLDIRKEIETFERDSVQ